MPKQNTIEVLLLDGTKAELNLDTLTLVIGGIDGDRPYCPADKLGGKYLFIQEPPGAHSLDVQTWNTRVAVEVADDEARKGTRKRKRRKPRAKGLKAIDVQALSDPDAQRPDDDEEEEPFTEEPVDVAVEDDDADSVDKKLTEHLCVYCDRKLTASELKTNAERLHKGKLHFDNKLNLDDLVCSSSECQAELRSTCEETVPAASQQNRRVDFIYITQHEVNDLFDGRPLNDPLLNSAFTTPVAVPPELRGTTEPGTPEFTDEVLAIYKDWFKKSAPRNIVHGTGYHFVENRKQLLRSIINGEGAVTAETLTKAVEGCRTLIYVPELMDFYPRRSPSDRPKRKPGRPKKEKSDEPEGIRWLRRELGLKTREITRWMDDPRFNQPLVATDMNVLGSDPKFANAHKRILAGKQATINGKRFTRMGDLLNLLPMKQQQIFTSNQIRFYRDYASGNYTEAQLIERHGSSMVSGLVGLENDIIRHLAFAKIINSSWGRDGVSIDSLEHHWALESQAILSGAADGGSIIAGKMNHNTGHRYPLYSFEIGQDTKMVRSSETGSTDTGGPDYDVSGGEDDSFDPD